MADIHVRSIPDEVRTRLKQKAQERGISLQQLLREIVERRAEEEARRI